MKLVVPKEIALGENRVGVTPDSVPSLKKMGFDVFVESDAGLSSSFTNEDYKKAIRSHRTAVAELQSDIINSSNLTFHEYGLELIDKHSSLKNKFSSKDLMPYKSRALESLEKLNNINYDEGINFDNFLIDFNSKLNN